MYFKKFTAFILSGLMILGFTACKNDEPVNETTQKIHEEITEEYLSDYIDDESTVPSIEDDITEVLADVTSNITETSAVSVKDISAFTDEEIIETYKNAAIKSHSSVTSQHAVEITNIIINGEELGSGFDFIKKIINTFISNNTEDTKGITGGYKNLAESDVASAKIYKVGNNTSIEMTMKNQTDGAKTDIHSGSVGHAIDVVGDISVVTDELSELGLPIEIPSESTSIHYTNPVVKVVVDENGKIIKGTWSYTVEIRLKNYKVFGADVQSSSIIMDNVITVNGGF